ncbi:MAG: hypothetical protein ACMUJM_15555 [bacterium]
MNHEHDMAILFIPHDVKAISYVTPNIGVKPGDHKFLFDFVKCAVQNNRTIEFSINRITKDMVDAIL